ncbi:MAG: ribosome biogenesis GTPase YlqF [Clostridia bacterium]|nr:ribosome biogenesis GTPase YlqF [Clostridia bacterium]
MNTEQTIQWFPGHMAKAERKIKEQLGIVDAVAEIIDARIPVSSRNPDLSRIISNKPRIVILNKCDMADPKATADWINYYNSQGIAAVALDCRSGKGINKFSETVKKELAGKLEYYRSKGLVGKPLRVMVVGIPNVGKSTFINRIAGGNKAKAENRPGVTRGNQWFTIDKELELLDTPGVLWPKFEDATVGEHLAFTGAVKDNVIDTLLLAVKLCEYLRDNYKDLIEQRYKITVTDKDAYDIFCEIGKKRGFLARGGETDEDRTANMLLEEFRNCKIGNITIEKVDK